MTSIFLGCKRCLFNWLPSKRTTYHRFSTKIIHGSKRVIAMAKIHDLHFSRDDKVETAVDAYFDKLDRSVFYRGMKTLDHR